SSAATELLRRIGIETDDISALNITEGVRTVLRSNPNSHFTATDIRLQVKANGFDLSKHTNPLATIHMVLKRIEQQGDAISWEIEGKTAYQWSGRSLPMGLDKPAPQSGWLGVRRLPETPRPTKESIPRVKLPGYKAVEEK